VLAVADACASTIEARKASTQAQSVWLYALDEWIKYSLQSVLKCAGISN